MKIKEQSSQRMVVGNIIIDKQTKSIISRWKKFVFFGRRMIIPFSRVGVGSITVERKTGHMTQSGGGGYFWRVSLKYGVPRVGVKKLTITESGNEEKMRRLADKISKFIGK